MTNKLEPVRERVVILLLLLQAVGTSNKASSELAADTSRSMATLACHNICRINGSTRWIRYTTRGLIWLGRRKGQYVP